MRELWNKDMGLDELNNSFMVALLNSDENISIERIKLSG